MRKKSPAEKPINQPEKSNANPIDKEIDETQKQLQANRNLSLMVEKHNAVALWHLTFVARRISLFAHLDDKKSTWSTNETRVSWIKKKNSGTSNFLLLRSMDGLGAKSLML